MTDSPYAPTSEAAATAPPSASTSTRRLWIGFLIAPIVPPVLAAILIFAGGLLFYDPNGAGTPMGIILVPIVFLTAGVFFSYLLALTVGMPIALLLHRSNKLTGANLHLAALCVSFVLATLVIIVGLLTDGRVTLSEGALSFGMSWLIIAPFVLIETSVFWWIVGWSSTLVNTKDFSTELD